MGYKILEHTSDLYIQGEGNSFEKAIEGIADGMFRIMREGSTNEKEIGIKYSAYDKEMLLIGLFSKILSECEINSFIPNKMKVIKFDEKLNKIEVKIYGKYGILENIIKAVTYHLFKIERENNKYKIRILFDI